MYFRKKLQCVRFSLITDADPDYSFHCDCYRKGSVCLYFEWEDRRLLMDRWVPIKDYEGFLYLHEKPHFVKMLHRFVDVLTTSGMNAFSQRYYKVEERPGMAQIVLHDTWLDAQATA